MWPEPVEDVLRAQPDVADVAVAGAPDDEWGHVVTAFVVADAPGAPTLRGCATPSRKAPGVLRAPPTGGRPENPRSALGKVRRLSSDLIIFFFFYIYKKKTHAITPAPLVR